MAITQPSVATFDCYGTLVDWDGGLASFLYAHALEFGDPGDENGEEMRVRWEEIQFGLIQGPYRSYKEVLAESLRRWMTERGLPWEPARGEALVRAMRSWQPFPDTIPALRQTAASGMRLAILSNTDRDIIAHTLRHLAIPFAAVVTAEDVAAYKPSIDNFRQVLDAVGGPPETVIHVAFGFKYDIGPAASLGMRTAWVNRRAEPKPPGARPDHVWRDLWDLAVLVGGRGPGF